MSECTNFVGPYLPEDAEPGEPVFVLLGRDPRASILACLLLALGASADCCRDAKGLPSRIATEDIALALAKWSDSEGVAPCSIDDAYRAVNVFSFWAASAEMDEKK